MKITRQNVALGSSGDKNPRLNEMISVLQKKRHDFKASTSYLKEKKFYKKPSMIKQEKRKKLKLKLKYSKHKK